MQVRRVAGLRLPYLPAFVVQVAEKASKAVSDFFADPRDAVEEQIRAIIRDVEKDRIRSTERAVEDGLRLLCLRINPCDEGFMRQIARIGISPRTARNKMALALFSQRYPDLYAKLKVLGPSKLYRIAVLNPQHIHKINIDDPIDTPRGQIPLRQLTCKEFEAWLRQTAPVAERKSWIAGVQKRIDASRRLLERNSDRATDPRDLEVLQNSLKDIEARVAAVLERHQDEDPPDLAEGP